MSSGEPLNLAILGTRGVPARYGGFETFAEELSARLVSRGHSVTVYGRRKYVPGELQTHRGARLRVLPGIRTKHLDTVSHTLLSAFDALRHPFDACLVCNGANAFACWIPRLRQQAVVLNVDGIERQRKKWGWMGRNFYLLSESLARWLPSQVVTDARTIQHYYLERHRLHTRFIPYGASLERAEGTAELERLGLRPGAYLLYVSRLEPENNAHLAIQAYLAGGVDLPLVVVGDAPYNRPYKERLQALASRGEVLMPGAIYGTGYRELITHCLCYLHGTEVGGTHPALIEAMGVGALCIVNETPENREVLGGCGLMISFNDVTGLGSLLNEVAAGTLQGHEALRQKARDRIRRCYDWNKVTEEYENLFYELSK